MIKMTKGSTQMKNCLLDKRNISFHMSGSSSIIQPDSHFPIDMALDNLKACFSSNMAFQVSQSHLAGL